MGKIPVFLVDDHPIVREGIRRLLEVDDDLNVVGEASSGEEALDQLRYCSPKVILMDIQLPGISGIEATEQIKAQYPDVRVVILSAFGQEHLAQAIEAGADGYVLKTASHSQLVEATKEAAEGRKPLDHSLTEQLFDHFAELYKKSQSQGLSRRQLAILQRVAQGVSSKVIAAEVAISEATFKRDMRGIFDYLEVVDRAQAVAEAYKQNILRH